MRHATGLLLGGLLTLALAPSALRAELPQPACEALAGWVEGYDRRAGWSPNGLGGRDRFSALFAEPATAALFGKPVLEWTPQEARALAPHLAACGDALRRAGNRAAGEALGRLRIHAQREVPNYLEALAEARAEVPQRLAELAGQPATPALLRFHLALGQIGQADDAAAQAGQAARRLTDPARGQARAVMSALRQVPEAEMAGLVAPAAAALPALRTGLRAALVAEAEAVPLTLAGLQALDAQARTLAGMAEDLGAEEAARVEASLAARHSAIGGALRDALIAQVAEVPADLTAADRLARLDRSLSPQQAAAMGADGVGAVRAAIAARRGEIGRALVDQTIARMASLPATPSALRLLHRQETEEPNPAAWVLIGPDGLRRLRTAARDRRTALGPAVAQGLREAIAAVPPTFEGFATLDRLSPAPVLALLAPEAAQQVRDAAVTRRGEIATAALPGFRAELDGMPDSEESLDLLDGVVLRGIARWPDSAEAERARFTALAKERRAAILAALDRAEAGPMRGRQYEGPKLRLEFLDATRVVLTEPGEPPEAGSYTEEPDGRVIVSVGTRSLVLTREGRRLVAGTLVLRRVK